MRVNVFIRKRASNFQNSIERFAKEIKKNSPNKKIDINNKKTPEMVKAVSDKSYELEYISGATITSDGLNEFIASHVLDRYKTILLEVN